MDKIFDGKKSARLGTEKRPATVTVQTEERKQELEAVFSAGNWAYTIEVDPDMPEDIADLERLQNPILPTIVDPKVGRNDPCPCGSKKKYKKCCGQS